MPSANRPKRPAGPMPSAVIRQSYLDYFAERGHAVVPSAPLVPAGDQSLLFTNSGMVQFKDVFLGTGERPYTRAVDSQKCMRVAGKHNDLDDVGRDDSHHTFFEMLGNWSFGDYYKQEAIAWAWELLTEVWGLPRAQLWATCFEDEQGIIPRDDEAAELWRQQAGFNPKQLLFFGRKDNFWEMAETGPCGPDSEVHIDLGPDYCNKQGVPGHACRVNGDCQRFLELWNLVFIQYNRRGPTDLDPLPKKHVDTGMGFERVVSVLQQVDSNYKTDLFSPIFARIQELAGHSEAERRSLLTPYRVIADHVRAATFLIADGVVPGNTGRNYVCRMIIRRASRFGTKAGFSRAFLARIVDSVLEAYVGFYPELERNADTIKQTLTDEEDRFHHTVELGVSHLEGMLQALDKEQAGLLAGDQAFELYATYGLPLEISRDIAREQGYEVDEPGFRKAMEAHRVASSSGESLAGQPQDDVEFYAGLMASLREQKKLAPEGVRYDPYHGLESEGPLLAIIKDGQLVQTASAGDEIGLVIPTSHLYLEAGGQVADTGTMVSVAEPRWEIHIDEPVQPVGGLIVHRGRVIEGKPQVGDMTLAAVDSDRRGDIMRNHTATHLLHASLRSVLGEHARQAGSLVAPDRLRFDFTHPKAMGSDEIQRVERQVNEAILANFPLSIKEKPRQQAITEGAMALFGENYGDIVRTVTIGDIDRFSYELCGGTHVSETGVIGMFLITAESSVAAGIRRIEAVTGHGALALVEQYTGSLKRLAHALGTSPEGVEQKVKSVLEELAESQQRIEQLQRQAADSGYADLKSHRVAGVEVLSGILPGADADLLRQYADRFRNEHSSGIAALGSVRDGRPLLIVAVTADLVERGLDAVQLARGMSAAMGGGGGGKPSLAQAGGKHPEKLGEALASLEALVAEALKA
jgi:alanyl-tRNA synthetase